MSGKRKKISFSLFSWLQSRSYPMNIRNSNVFKLTIERERSRTDRSQGIFSLLVFDVKKSKNNGQQLDGLTKTIIKRIRPSDLVGWLGKDRIGVLLPDTAPKGAIRLYDDIRAKMPENESGLSYDILTYPLSEKKNERNKSIAEKDTEKLHTNESANKSGKELVDKISVRGLGFYMGKAVPVWKRTIDIFGAGLGLLILLPVFLGISIVIKFASPGPILFKQKRVGFLKKPFLCLKFRTMKINSDENLHTEHLNKLICEGKPLEKMDDNDSRIYAFGSFLRKTCLDELPQLINVLRGEMSLVGPRPEIYNILHMYNQWQLKRFDVNPGITGLWQINGKNNTTFKEMMIEDILYVENRSFWLDTKIILKTFPAIFTPLLKNQINAMFKR